MRYFISNKQLGVNSIESMFKYFFIICVADKTRKVVTCPPTPQTTY